MAFFWCEYLMENCLTFLSFTSNSILFALPQTFAKVLDDYRMVSKKECVNLLSMKCQKTVRNACPRAPIEDFK